MTVTFAEPVDAEPFRSLGGGVRVTGSDGRQLRLSAPPTAMDALVKAIARQTVVDVVVEPADLEEIFLELYREGDDGS